MTSTDLKFRTDKLEHLEMYPDYKYRPLFKKNKRDKRVKQQTPQKREVGPKRGDCSFVASDTAGQMTQVKNAPAEPIIGTIDDGPCILPNRFQQSPALAGEMEALFDLDTCCVSSASISQDMSVHWGLPVDEWVYFFDSHWQHHAPQPDNASMPTWGQFPPQGENLGVYLPSSLPPVTQELAA